MVLMTMIARVADALPLAASMQEDEQVSGLDTSLLLLLFIISFNLIIYKFYFLIIAKIVPGDLVFVPCVTLSKICYNV